VPSRLRDEHPMNSQLNCPMNELELLPTFFLNFLGGPDNPS